MDLKDYKTVADYATALCQKNNIVIKRTLLDDFADKITELSDNDVEPDMIRDKLVVLSRNGLLSKADVVLLYSRHLNEQ